MKKGFLIIFATLLLSACTKEAKIEELSKEVDKLVYEGKYLEAAEAQAEINALRQGEEYIRDENPEETMELKYKSNFEYLEISNTSITWSDDTDTGYLNGEISNIGSKALDGYFGVYFFDENGVIVDNYTTYIPDNGINPGETKYFSVPLNKLDYSYYEFQGETITEK